MRIRSLRVRLLLMFLLIIVVALGALAIFASQLIQRGIQQYQENEQVTNQQVLAHIQTTYHQPQDTQQLQAFIERSAAQAKTRILVIDQNQRVIADSTRKLTGQTLTISLFLTLESNHNALTGNTSLPTTLFPPSTSIFSTDGRIIAAGSQPPPATSFLDAMNRALGFAVLIAGGVAFVLAFTLSGTILKPVRALTHAARRLEQGDLSQRVQIRGRDEIGELAHAFDTMAESLERSELQRRQLLNDVAHELRTPLTNVRGYLEALQDQVIEPEPAMIASIYEEAMLLNRLITDLQDITLAEAGQLHLHREPIALEDAIIQAVQAVSLQAESKQLALSTHLPENLPLVEADAQRVGQILRNLLQNAIKYTPEQGKVSVSAQAFQQEVLVSVRDTGVGIAPEQLPMIFKHFYRADTSRTRETGGSGLGLAVVEHLVHAHGGQVTVQSHVGRGSCFTFTLPTALSTCAQKESKVLRSNGEGSCRAARD